LAISISGIGTFQRNKKTPFTTIIKTKLFLHQGINLKLFAFEIQNNEGNL
jgi:hypothetical protein